MCVSLCRARLEKSPHLHASSTIVSAAIESCLGEGGARENAREAAASIVALCGFGAGVDSLVPAERPRVARRIPAARRLAAVRLNPCAGPRSEPKPVKEVLGKAGHERDDAPLWVRMWRLRLFTRLDV